MIVAVKTNSKKRFFIKLASAIVVVGMFILYYFHMSNEFANQQKKEQESKLKAVEIDNKLAKQKKLERIIYKEVETAVDLIGQRHVQDVKIISHRALIVVDLGTNLDALKVRYGSSALIKKDLKDIKVAIDLKYILESKINED
ncbi:hypothetical protein CP965_06855 [Halarcobacter mediterraneus]|uniref:Uncharacterized protein n=1 Tax=Halarcobacter mediterraneus TaxID=2023153 RepID=A0A4Q1B5D4_9BACT|nr:hypothetical protein [Halarcobacter mediterraneus]RXK13517.1 hypothetical protein CP965_06855 [Halarcobacter mediterraneus]